MEIFGYEKFRSFKDGFMCEESKGFVDGEILGEFLLMSEEMKRKY